jgi:hypothetical protein
MTLPVTTDGVPVIGAYGDVYTAPAGTAAPTDVTTPGTPWVKLGLISEDGATWTLPTEETTDIMSWQSQYPVRRVTTSMDTSVNFALMEWDRETLPFALGGGTFTDGATVVTFHPPGAGQAESKAIYVYVRDGTIEFGIYMEQGRVTDRGESNFKPDEAALLDITFSIEVSDPSADPYQLLFKTSSFPVLTVSGTEAEAPTGAEVPAL